jgi:aminoglycoside phosphotransferase (APT) family kinase protein
MLDSKKLEDYIRLAAHYGNFSLVPTDARNVRVFDIEKLGGGMANNVYSFVLKFSTNGLEQHFELVLKGYTEYIGLWFRIHHPDEDIRQYIREFQALKSLSSINFPVPQVYLCECDSFFLGYPFLIMSKEKVMKETVGDLDCFATTLARLHNLKVNELGIKALRFPKDGSEFARERQICLKRFLNETRHYRSLRKDFDYAIKWLDSKIADNTCPQYCLIHGEYHPGHVKITNDNQIRVMDWQSVQIGDPAFDVGYAYHLIKLMNDNKNSNSTEKFAQRFVSEYTKNFQGNVDQRLEFYKLLGILGIAVVVSSWISNPVEAYRRFGNEAFVRSLAFPFIRSQLLVERWLNADFFVSCLQYCQNYIQTTFRR